MFDVIDVTVSGPLALWVMQAQGFHLEEDCVKTDGLLLQYPSIYFVTKFKLRL